MRELRVRVISLALLMFVLPALGCGGDDDDTTGNSSGTGGMNGNPGTSTATGGTSAAGAGNGAAMDGDACAQFCAKAVPLKCPNDTTPCATKCATYYNNSFCQAELRALIECSAKQPASDFECDDQQQGSVKMCMSERTAVETCVANQ